MLLKQLLKNVSCDVVGDLNINIQGLFFDSRKDVKNGLFFCLQGTNTNGSKFILQAKKMVQLQLCATKS